MAWIPRPGRRAVAGAAAALAGLATCVAGCSREPAEPDPAVTAVEAQICGLVADGALSKAEIASLGRVLDRAHSLGLPAAILDPAHEVVTAGKATDDEIARLRAACR